MMPGQTWATVNTFHTLEGTVPVADVCPHTSLYLGIFQGPANLPLFCPLVRDVSLNWCQTV